MNKILYLIIFLIISNCAQNKVVKHHGVHFLDKKQEKLVLNSTNVNDILLLMGPPSTQSTFDNDILIYIESFFDTVNEKNNFIPWLKVCSRNKFFG